MTLPQQHKDPMHGVTLQMILERLVEHYGWDDLGIMVRIRCFNFEPSIKSSLAFLRRTPWAREKVEKLYLQIARAEQKKAACQAQPPEPREEGNAST